MDDARRRNVWAERIERRLSAGVPIKERCRLNKVSESSLYRWMAVFRGEEPGRFPRRASRASNWIRVTRGGIADAKAIVPAGDASAAVREPGRPDPSGAGGDAASPIRALVGRVELAIPAGSAGRDI